MNKQSQVVGNHITSYLVNTHYIYLLNFFSLLPKSELAHQDLRKFYFELSSKMSPVKTSSKKDINHNAKTNEIKSYLGLLY